MLAAPVWTSSRRCCHTSTTLVTKYFYKPLNEADREVV